MREHEQFRSPWNKEEENDQIIINVDHQKEKENKKNKNFRGQWKNSRHHPLSRPLPKERKMEKKKIQRIFKKYIFQLTWRTMFLESSKLPQISRCSTGSMPYEYRSKFANGLRQISGLETGGANQVYPQSYGKSGEAAKACQQ